MYVFAVVAIVVVCMLCVSNKRKEMRHSDTSLYIYTVLPRPVFCSGVKKNWLNYTTCLFTGGIFRDFWGMKREKHFGSTFPAPKIFYFSNDGF